MSTTPLRILYCHCAFARVVPADVKSGVLARLAESSIEFEAVPARDGTLCQNGKWRAFDGGASGTTAFRVFFKNGVIRGFPLDK